MTENLLQKLEEKMMLLVAEIEDARKEIENLTHENLALKSEKDRHSKKLNDLLSLLDVVEHDEPKIANSTHSTVTPLLVKDAKDTVVG